MDNLVAVAEVVVVGMVAVVVVEVSYPFVALGIDYNLDKTLILAELVLYNMDN